MARSVYRIRTDSTVLGKNPAVGEIYRVFQTGLEAHPAPCALVTGYFPEVERPKFDADHPAPSKDGLLIGWNHISPSPVCFHRYVMGQR